MTLNASSSHSPKVSTYWRRFEDGSPSRWGIERKEAAWHVSLPDGTELTISASEPEIDWSGTFPKRQGSTQLWVNSLRYLIPILEADEVEVVFSVLSSFEEHLRLHQDKFGTLKSGSIDHQSALQLRTFCESRAWIASRLNSGSDCEMQILEDLDNLLCQCVRLVCRLIDELELLQANNHGVMAGIAVLHSECIFAELEVFATSPSAEEFLYSSLIGILGEDGLANENTPVYQGFYIRLIDEIVEFLNWTGRGSADRFKELSERAQTPYRHLIIPGGLVAPIGDSAASPQSRFTSAPGVWSSPENGVFVSSSQSTFLSFVCGYRGVFHKQMDDTSLILWHKGRFLLQDGGLVSYAESDPVAVAIRGQLGHSGLYFREFDSVRAESVIAFGPGTRTVKAEMTVNDESEKFLAQVTGNVNFRQTRVKRQISVTNENQFLIRDEVLSAKSESEPVSRFLLDPEATVEVAENGGLMVENGGVWMSLYSPTGFAGVEFFRGDYNGHAGPRGFFAPRSYAKQPTTLIDIPLRLSSDGTGKRLILVAFGEKSEGAEVWTG